MNKCRCHSARHGLNSYSYVNAARADDRSNAPGSARAADRSFDGRNASQRVRVFNCGRYYATDESDRPKERMYDVSPLMPLTLKRAPHNREEKRCTISSRRCVTSLGLSATSALRRLEKNIDPPPYARTFYVSDYITRRLLRDAPL